MLDFVTKISSYGLMVSLAGGLLPVHWLVWSGRKILPRPRCFYEIYLEYDRPPANLYIHIATCFDYESCYDVLWVPPMYYHTNLLLYFVFFFCFDSHLRIIYPEIVKSICYSNMHVSKCVYNIGKCLITTF